MGQLIPSDFDVESLEPSERRVVSALVSGTDDAWLILPTVPFVDRGRDGEADIVVLNATYGAVVIEVKGGRITVADGRWFQDGRPLKRSPAAQAVSAKHTLLRKVQQVRGVVGTDRVFFKHAVAFPDAAAVPHGGLGPDPRARHGADVERAAMAGRGTRPPHARRRPGISGCHRGDRASVPAGPRVLRRPRVAAARRQSPPRRAHRGRVANRRGARRQSACLGRGTGWVGQDTPCDPVGATGRATGRTGGAPVLQQADGGVLRPAVRGRATSDRRRVPRRRARGGSRRLASNRRASPGHSSGRTSCRQRSSRTGMPSTPLSTRSSLTRPRTSGRRGCR